MAINPDIRDAAYQFFIEEAPDLLQAIEAGLLTLRQEHSTAKVHNLMRCAHSLKGGAASVELEAIATLAHRLENIFKALYSEALEIDTDLESQLLQAYDCLRLPLMEQIKTGKFNAEQALAIADPIFALLEERFADALTQAETYIPSSSELGVDMTKSIFEVDVQEGLDRLAEVVAHPGDYEVAGELRAQAEVFLGFAELLNEPGFKAIAATVLAALDAYPERALVITQLALSDFTLARQAVLAGYGQGTSASKAAPQTHTQEITPCAALVALANSTVTKAPKSTAIPTAEPTIDTELLVEEQEDAIPSIEDVFGSAFGSFGTEHDEYPSAAKVLYDTQISVEDESLESIFGNPEEYTEESPTLEVLDNTQIAVDDEALEAIFSIADEIADEDTEEYAVPEVSENTQSPTQEGALEETVSIGSQELVSSTPILQSTPPLTTIASDTTQSAIASQTDTDLPDSSGIIHVESIAEARSGSQLAIKPSAHPQGDEDWGVPSSELMVQGNELSTLNPEQDGFHPHPLLGEALDAPFVEEPPSLEEVFSSAFATPQTEAALELNPENRALPTRQDSSQSPISDCQDLITDAPDTLEEAVQSIEQIFEKLPAIQDVPEPTSGSKSKSSTEVNLSPASKDEAPIAANLTVRVDSERLGRMNNLVGELAINRNGLSLQNEQLQGSVRELLNRFSLVQNLVGDLRKLSDQMLVAPQRHHEESFSPAVSHLEDVAIARADFDSLELDSYGVLHLKLQALLEDMMQLEESVDDIVLFARATDQTLEQQRQMLTQLRDELMWARMLPLGEVLNRFPRMLRDFSTTYHKPVSLKLFGTSVLVDKAVLEKLYDPLLHLLRNAFDHGIESPEVRRAKGKPEQGQIEIRAYHRGSQTIIEVKDDGQGLNLERIGARAVELGLLNAKQLAMTTKNQLFELVFEPGFSTKSQVSELSGRGVGLDVVRSQMRSLKGAITVTSEPRVGSTFTLRLPLTLTIAKLLVCFSGTTALALPSDSIEEIVVPKADQIKQSGTQQFLYWRGEIVPTYRLADLLEYTCPLPETSTSRALSALPSPASWALPMLVVRQEQNFIALEIERLVTEQELVIKPFGEAIAPPSCTYGCTILGDGSLIPVIDAATLLDQVLKPNTAADDTATRLNSPDPMALESPSASSANENASLSNTKVPIKTAKAPTILVVDDAAALRRTLAFTLERVGCRVLQARDGREALEQLQQSSSVELVICDIEMPNMNGFEFLSARRQNPEFSKVPVIMLTSRSNDKHRWLAMQLGATAYFTKPYLEQEFLAAIKQLIGQSTPDSLPVLQPVL